MNLPYPFEIVQLPNRIIFFYEALHNFGLIWTDGRPRPDDFVPALMGHSVGHWEGDTLVIETIGLTDRTWLDDFGNQHSGEMTVVERYWRPDSLKPGDCITIEGEMARNGTPNCHMRSVTLDDRKSVFAGDAGDADDPNASGC